MIKNLHMTDLTTFQDCRRRFYNDKIIRITSTSHNNELNIDKVTLSPETDSTFPMTFGTIGHKVLEDWYARRIPLLESLENHGKQLRADYYEIAQSLFTEYEQVYASDKDKYKVLLVETPIAVDYPYPTLDAYYMPTKVNQPVELNIDVIVESVENGAIYAMDHKFYASMPSVEELNMRDQFTGYTSAVRRTGYDVKGVIANILCKRVVHNPNFLASGKLSKDKSQSTTYARYKYAVDMLAAQPTYDKAGNMISATTDVSEYDEMLDLLANAQHPSLRRHIILKTQLETQTWDKRLIPRLQDIDRAIRTGAEAFYHNPGRQCLNCQFLRLCNAQLQGGDGKGYMETMYRHKKDDER